MRRFSIIYVTVCFAFAPQSRADELEEPVPIVVGNGILDVEHSGYASPLVVDFDGDGKRDLLVGEQLRLANESTSRLRLYLNQGRNDEPRFERFQYVSDGAPSRYLPVSCYRDFVPQYVDLDGDGQMDLITGTWAFEILLFRGQGNGKFAAGEPLKDGEGKTLNVAYGVAVSAADWDGDGDLDIVAGGTAEQPAVGEVFLIRNNGLPKEYKFAKPEPLKVGEKLIEVPDREAVPCVADWDGDGKLDLVIGCGDGSVRFYRNTGTRQVPAFDKFETLVPAPAGATDRGKSARPCVVDWNEDGRLDLVVGDCGKQFDKVLNPEEDKMRQEAQRKQNELFNEWAGVFSRYRKLAADSKDAASAELFRAELDELRNKMVALNEVRDRCYQQEQMLQPGKQTHGRVWLFLRAAK